MPRNVTPGKPPSFLLVIQLPQTHFGKHAELVAFEDRLIASMPRSSEVDGHDIGSGTTNFFIYTSAPLAAFKAFRKYLGTNAVERNLRVSYRSVDGDQFTNLWPFRDARPFALLYEKGDDPFSAASKRLIPKRSPPGVSKFATPAAPAPKKKTTKKKKKKPVPRTPASSRSK